MDEERDKPETGFRITDRRMFNEKGERRDEEQQEAPKQEPAEPAGAAARQRSLDPREPEESGASIDFASFALSLATTGLVHLGEVPDPASGQRTESLEAAQQMIDILALLEDKTRGNLTPEESQLLEGLLYELRMKFLAKKKFLNLG
jgi:hypothetical protein